jgi:VCBS repeat-containing protein
VTSDHQPGAEATSVKVTVSQTCSAIAYNSHELTEKATSLLTTQALQKTGAGYSLFGTPHIQVIQATISSTTPPLVFLSFNATGTWIYGISAKVQQKITHLIAGKPTQEALHLLAALPGVEHVAIRFTGFTDVNRLPKNSSYIHIMLLVS